MKKPLIKNLKLKRGFIFIAILSVFIIPIYSKNIAPVVMARSAVTPWQSELDLQNLVYGGSTVVDVLRIMGHPNEIVREEQMYPLLENYYYYENGNEGAATVFVFENNLLVGLLFKSADNQFVDLTYFLPNNGDYQVNLPIWGKTRGYYPNFPMYTW